MKIRVYCEKCEKEYVIDLEQTWVGLMTCPHEIEHHFFKEVIDDEESTLSGRD